MISFLNAAATWNEICCTPFSIYTLSGDGGTAASRSTSVRELTSLTRPCYAFRKRLHRLCATVNRHCVSILEFLSYRRHQRSNAVLVASVSTTTNDINNHLTNTLILSLELNVLIIPHCLRLVLVELDHPEEGVSIQARLSHVRHTHRSFPFPEPFQRCIERSTQLLRHHALDDLSLVRRQTGKPPPAVQNTVVCSERELD